MVELKISIEMIAKPYIFTIWLSQKKMFDPLCNYMADFKLPIELMVGRKCLQSALTS
jgi:hypothetical protein